MTELHRDEEDLLLEFMLNYKTGMNTEPVSLFLLINVLSDFEHIPKSFAVSSGEFLSSSTLLTTSKRS